MSLLQLLIPGVPILAFPVSLWVGFRKTIWCVLGIAVLIAVAPYVYFGIWALIEGVSVKSTFEALRAVSSMFPVILAYMVLWSVVYAAVGATLRFGWVRWRAA